jgi:hypothetical protein
VNVKHLRTLHELALTIPEDRLDMGSWVDDQYICDGVWRKPDENHCGTVACLLGHACQVSAFQAAGLRLDVDGTPIFQRSPSGAVHRGIEAAMACFEIPYSIAADLFGWRTTDPAETPESCAAKIAELLELAE